MSATDLFTLADLSNEVCLNVGDTSDVTQAFARKWINRALIRFSEVGYWPWQYAYQQSVSTVAAQTTVDITNAIKVTSLYMSSPIQRNLVLVEDRQFRAMFPNDTFTGCPYFYHVYGNSYTTANTLKLALYPIPDAIYSLKFDVIRPINLLSSDTDDIRVVTGMPSNLVDLVVEMATAIGYKADDDVKSGEQMKEAMLRLQQAYEDATTQINDRLIAAPFGDYDTVADAMPLFPPQYSWD